MKAIFFNQDHIMWLTMWTFYCIIYKKKKKKHFVMLRVKTTKVSKKSVVTALYGDIFLLVGHFY